MYIVKVSSNSCRPDIHLRSPQFATPEIAQTWRDDLRTRLMAEGWVPYPHTMMSLPDSRVAATDWLRSRDGKTQIDLAIEEVTNVVAMPAEAVIKIAKLFAAS